MEIKNWGVVEVWLWFLLRIFISCKHKGEVCVVFEPCCIKSDLQQTNHYSFPFLFLINPTFIDVCALHTVHSIHFAGEPTATRPRSFGYAFGWGSVGHGLMCSNPQQTTFSFWCLFFSFSVVLSSVGKKKKRKCPKKS